jgi:hypothetical protein
LAAALPGAGLVEIEAMGHEPVAADVDQFGPALLAHLRTSTPDRQG